MRLGGIDIPHDRRLVGHSDADPHATAAPFQRDSSDVFSKLARYETSIERSLYKALHELQRLQAARAGGNVVPPVTVDVNVDAGEAVAGF